MKVFNQTWGLIYQTVKKKDQHRWSMLETREMHSPGTFRFKTECAPKSYACFHLQITIYSKDVREGTLYGAFNRSGECTVKQLICCFAQ